MGTWTAVIVATQGRADFWRAARAEGVEPDTSAVPPLALIDVDARSDFESPILLAQTLSTVLSTAAIGFAAQTGSDAYEIRAFDHGECMRHLAYSRDDDGWLAADGRTRAFVNDELVGVALLKDIGASLLEVHGLADDQSSLAIDHRIADAAAAREIQILVNLFRSLGLGARQRNGLRWCWRGRR